MQFISAKDYIHKWKALEELPAGVLLLHHAAAYAYHELRILVLALFQRAYVAVYPLLSVLANAAGIEYYKVGLGLVLSFGVTHFLHHAGYFFRVVLVHLAAVGFYMVSKAKVINFVFYSLCRGLGGCYLCRRNKYWFFHQNTST